MKFLIIIVFNLVFGLAFGFVGTRIFNHRGYSTNPDDNRKQWQSEKKDILIITAATIICGLLCYWLFDKNPSTWKVKGFIFGNMVSILSIFLIYTRSQVEELLLRPAHGVVINGKLDFITELFKTFSFPGGLWLALISLVYGYIFLIIPLTSLAWGYLTYRHLIKL